MPTGERAAEGSRPRARATSVVVPFPRRHADDRLDLAALVPSGRLLLLAFGVLLAGCAGWLIAKESPLFAVRELEVLGAPADVARQVERSLAHELGRSLLELDSDRLRTRVLGLPTVRGVTLDRAFPNTLRITVVPERPVAVLRRGPASWLVSARGRVMGPVDRGAQRTLPRIWLRRGVRVDPGTRVYGDPRTAVAAVAPLRRVGLRAPVAKAQVRGDGIALVLRSSLEVRLGDPADIRLKLMVAARILPSLEPEVAYLDVSVPERPVAGTDLNSQVEGETQASTDT